MITAREFSELGNFKNSWLDARYHFSFSGYYDPAWTGLNNLRVINDDIVKAGGGFDFHSHKEMEIITYVRSGAITHRDNLGNTGKTGAGEVQVMSAGTGVTHAEHNEELVDTNLYQIWIYPNKPEVAPRWEQKAFPKIQEMNILKPLASGLAEHEKSDALYIHADAAIYGGVLGQGGTYGKKLGKHAYVLVSEGTILLNNIELHKGDGAALLDEPEIHIKATQTSEILLIDLP